MKTHREHAPEDTPLKRRTFIVQPRPVGASNVKLRPVVELASKIGRRKSSNKRAREP